MDSSIGNDYLNVERLEEDTMLMVSFFSPMELINAICFDCAHSAEKRFAHGTFHNAFQAYAYQAKMWRKKGK